MRALKMTWLLLAFIASFNTYAATMGQHNSTVECTESVQSGRFEGGEVEVKDYTSDQSGSAAASADR
jgi:hypothetical protein